MRSPTTIFTIVTAVILLSVVAIGFGLTPLAVADGSTILTDRPEDPEPVAFEIASVNGEPANQTNEVAFHERAAIDIALDGLNASEHRFNVTIGEHRYRIGPNATDFRPLDEDDVPEAGTYTLELIHTERGEELERAETDIEIVETEPDLPVDPKPVPFEIKTINGEPANQTNQVAFHERAAIEIELDGLNASENRFNVTIGEHRYNIGPNATAFRPRDDDIPEAGIYTLEIVHTERGEELESAETVIDIVETEPDRPIDPEPIAFEIASINGEPANQTNEVAFHERAAIEIALDGMNVSENRFNVTIGEHQYRIGPNATEFRPRDGNVPETGTYTLEVIHVERGEELERAKTEIDIVETEPDRPIDPEPVAFEIAFINGEPANQTNEVAFHERAPIEIALEGLNATENRFNVTIGEYRYRIGPNATAFRPREGDEIPEAGTYTLEIVHTERGEELEHASTEIDIVETEPDRPIDVEPIEFEIDQIDGQPADEMPRIGLDEPATIVLDLDGIDITEHAFNVTVGPEEFVLRPGNDGELRVDDWSLDPGEYELSVSHTERGEVLHQANATVELIAKDQVPTEFDVVAIDGIPTDEEMILETDALDTVHVEITDHAVAEHTFVVTIDGDRYEIAEDGTVDLRDAGLEPGEYDIDIAVLDDEERVHAETVAVTVQEPSADDREETDDDEDGLEDAIPGFGMVGTLVALSVLAAMVALRHPQR